jgi:bacterioferritin
VSSLYAVVLFLTEGQEKQMKIIDKLNQIMELELAGVVRYTHYSLMIYGYNRIPIVSWMKSNAAEGLDHAHRAGEMVTLLGGHPSLKIGNLDHERAALDCYYDLLKLAEKEKNILVEEYAREMITNEELHLDEVNKMLRKPGDVEPFKTT